MGSHRRRPFWIAKHFEYAAVNVGNNALTICSPSQLQQYSEDPTIIRIHGRLAFSFERDSGGFKESMRSDCYAGIYCANSELPGQDPGSSDLDDGLWMWSTYMYAWSTFVEYPAMSFDSNTYQNAASQPTLSRGTQHIPNSFENVEFDIKAMRKAPAPCSLILALDIAERLPETGAAHKMTGLIRVLVKE